MCLGQRRQSRKSKLFLSDKKHQSLIASDMALPIAIPAAASLGSLVLPSADFFISIHKACQEKASKASKLNSDYGERVKPRLSFITEY